MGTLNAHHPMPACEHSFMTTTYGAFQVSAPQMMNYYHSMAKHAPDDCCNTLRHHCPILAAGTIFTMGSSCIYAPLPTIPKPSTSSRPKGSPRLARQCIIGPPARLHNLQGLPGTRQLPLRCRNLEKQANDTFISPHTVLLTHLWLKQS